MSRRASSTMKSTELALGLASIPCWYLSLARPITLISVAAREIHAGVQSDYDTYLGTSTDVDEAFVGTDKSQHIPSQPFRAPAQPPPLPRRSMSIEGSFHRVM